MGGGKGGGRGVKATAPQTAAQTLNKELELFYYSCNTMLKIRPQKGHSISSMNTNIQVLISECLICSLLDYKLFQSG